MSILYIILLALTVVFIVANALGKLPAWPFGVTTALWLTLLTFK